MTFNKIPDISLTAVKFPDIYRFSRQVVSLSNVTELGIGIRPVAKRDRGGVSVVDDPHASCRWFTFAHTV